MDKYNIVHHVRRCEIVMPAVLKARSLDAFDAGTHSSLRATKGVYGPDFLAWPVVHCQIFITQSLSSFIISTI